MYVCTLKIPPDVTMGSHFGGGLDPFGVAVGLVPIRRAAENQSKAPVLPNPLGGSSTWCPPMSNVIFRIGGVSASSFRCCSTIALISFKRIMIVKQIVACAHFLHPPRLKEPLLRRDTPYIYPRRTYSNTKRLPYSRCNEEAQGQAFLIYKRVLQMCSTDATTKQTHASAALRYHQ